MKKKILSILMAAGMLVSVAGIASAAKDDNQGKAGPNGSNEHGLCTAYFNGQKNGHDKHGSPGPFAALEAASAPEDDNGDGEISQEEIAAAVYDYCQDYGIGGNPDHGRFLCEAGAAQDDPATPEDETDTTCTHTEGPGNS